MKNRVFIVLFFTAFCFVNVSLAAEVVYRCWSYNAGGFSSIRAMRCTNPALTLFPSGQYQLGSEKGTYKIKNGKLILSESKIRGEGKFLENDNQIQFEYDYKGAHHTLTYLLQRGSLSELKEPSSNREVASITPSYITKVELILDFSGQTKSLGWINAVKLVPQGEGDSAESIAPYGSHPDAACGPFAPSPETIPGFPRLVPGKLQPRNPQAPWDNGDLRPG